MIDEMMFRQYSHLILPLYLSGPKNEPEQQLTIMLFYWDILKSDPTYLSDLFTLISVPLGQYIAWLRPPSTQLTFRRESHW